MAQVTQSQFSRNVPQYIALAQHEPVAITARDPGRGAVVVSLEFYDRAVQALENQADIRDAARARGEAGRVSHDELIRGYGF